jgi:hypothetical protein
MRVKGVTCYVSEAWEIKYITENRTIDLKLFFSLFYCLDLLLDLCFS